MLKESVLMLLAMALAMAATTAHARVDLFGRLVTSNNQTHHNHNHVCTCPVDVSTKTSSTKQLGIQSSSKVNSDGAQVQVIEKVKGADLIPYPQCIKTCDQCICTAIWPVELSMCLCGDSTKTSSSTKPAAVSKSVAEWLPYPECKEKCDECVVCTKIFPIELASCLCDMNVKKAEGRASPTS